VEKAGALNAASLMARGEFLVCIESNVSIDPHAVTWFVRRMQTDGRLGVINGNPRARNGSSLIGRLVVGEFSANGLIKRTQTISGGLSTVPGIIWCFRKRAIHEAGSWSPKASTANLELTWRIQLARWHIAFEPNAICRVPMPETLEELWRQHLNSSEGVMKTVILSLPKLLSVTTPHWRGWIFGISYMLSIGWSCLVCLAPVLRLAKSAGIPVPQFLPILSGLPEWCLALGITYVVQAAISTAIDRRWERKPVSGLNWAVWYPLWHWTLQTATVMASLSQAVTRGRKPSGI
jgi:biofilm PGA synthesis N-glycosyltransferase PgaC